MSELKRLAEAAKEWSNANTVKPHPEWDGVCVVGHVSEDGEFYPVVEVDCDQYCADSSVLANYIAAASPDAILALIEERDRLRDALRDAVAALGGIMSDNVPETVRQALGAQ